MNEIVMKVREVCNNHNGDNNVTFKVMYIYGVVVYLGLKCLGDHMGTASLLLFVSTRF